MIDIKKLRSTPDAVRTALSRRVGDMSILDRIIGLDVRRRAALTAGDEMKAKKNAASKEIGKLKSLGLPADELFKSVAALAAGIATCDKEAGEADVLIEQLLLDIPNEPDPAIPDAGNLVEKTLGEPRPGTEHHWDIAIRLGLCDFDRGAKLSGARFYVLKGSGAKLERALMDLMLSMHIGSGYTEILPPLLVNRESMTGTGQYPKFIEESFSCERDGLALIPTAEVPVTNLHRDEILPALPVKYVACTPCFRREAGAAGKDTRGVIRVHQFHKVEIVKFVRPEDSPAEHETLTRDAERILEALELPYRRVLLAADDLGFASSKTYDLEVWMPGAPEMDPSGLEKTAGRYVEVSSCSNFTDYQARRMSIRFKREPGARPELVHTLNGSGLAVGRTWAAILENYLQPDGAVRIPNVLRAFMGCDVLR